METYKRVFVIVLDSLGIGAMPDLPPKKLVVRLPRAVAENLTEVQLNSVSADFDVAALTVKEALIFDSVSGDLETDFITADSAEVNTVSGKIDLDGSFRQVIGGSTSGEVDLALRKCPDKIELTTVSGDVDLELPRNAGFTLRYGYHHSTDDGKYLIMGNGTQAFAIAAEQREQENYMRTAELSTEQNYNMIDGQINNTPSVDELEEKAKRGEVISLSALAAAVKAEDGRTPQRDPDGKKPSIRAQLKADRAQSCKPQQREKEQEAKRSIRQALEME